MIVRFAWILTVLTSVAICVTAQSDLSGRQSRLSSAIESGNSEQKRTALAEIRNIRSEEASRIAIPALSDRDEMVRATAASSVVFLPESEAARVLLPLLDDKKPFVRREAAYALGAVGNWSATRRLTNILSHDRDVEARAAAAVALGSIGDHAALQSLAETLRRPPREKDEFLRRSSARAIGQILELYTSGSTYTVTPQNFLPPKFKYVGKRRDLNHLDAYVTELVPLLSKVLQNSKEAGDTRREAAFALGALGHPAAANILRSYLTSPDPYLAEISKEALLKIENQE